MRQWYDNWASVIRFIQMYGQHWTAAIGAIFRLRCHVRLVQGRLRNGDRPITMLYVGRGQNYDYIVNTALLDPKITSESRASLFRVRRHIEPLKSRADVVIDDIGWPYLSRLGVTRRRIVVPDWVNMIVDTDKPWDEIRRRFSRDCRRNDLRLIRRNNYSSDISTDPKDAAYFYDRMYAPFVRGRHGRAGIVESRRHVLRVAKKSILLRVFRDGLLICAGLIYRAPEELHCLWLGTDESNDGSAAEASKSALYYFGLRHAQDQGVPAFSIGGTRAFLAGGDLRFKRKWGAYAEDSFTPNVILIEPACSENGIAFCESQPCLIKTRAGFFALYVRRADHVGSDEFDRRWREIGCGGITGIIILCVTDDEATTVETRWVGRAKFIGIRCGTHGFTETISQLADLAEANSFMSSESRIDTGGVIDWPSGQTLDGPVARAGHRLEETGLFSDEKLIELFDTHDPDELLVYRMGSDHHQLDEFQFGSRGDLTAEQLLQQVYAGRLWLNIIHMMDNHPGFAELVNAMYDELEEKVPGFKTVFRNANLLVSSPSSKVYYHADAPLNMLWHVRGRKRVWVYPDDERFAPREWVEMIFTRESDDDLPYSPDFDQFARDYTLNPGEMLTWAQNTPHRVDNLEGLNVSLTTEHYTPRAMQKRMTYLSNHYLRRWFGLPTTGTRIDGPIPAAKRTLFRIARRLPGFNESREQADDAKFALGQR